MHHVHYLWKAIKKAMNALIIFISSAKHKSEIPFTSAQKCLFIFYTPDFTPSVKRQDKDCWGNDISWLFDFYKILGLSSVNRRFTTWLRETDAVKSPFLLKDCIMTTVFSHHSAPRRTRTADTCFIFLDYPLRVLSQHTSRLHPVCDTNSRSKTANSNIWSSHFPASTDTETTPRHEFQQTYSPVRRFPGTPKWIPTWSPHRQSPLALQIQFAKIQVSIFPTLRKTKDPLRAPCYKAQKWPHV